jgi:hypothetical protein
MVNGTISKILDYYYKKDKYKEELTNALRQFFDKPDLASGGELDYKENDMGFFNEWFMFDFRLKNGRTLLQDFCDKNPYNFSILRLQQCKDILDNDYGFFEVSRVDVGEGMKLKNLNTNMEYQVKEHTATFQLKTGDILVNRVAKVGDHFELLGTDGSPILADGTKSSIYKLLVGISNLNPKIIRDAFVK